jgi:hypothetical protein
MNQSCGWIGKIKANIGTPRSGIKNTDFRTPMREIKELNNASMLQRAGLGFFKR